MYLYLLLSLFLINILHSDNNTGMQVKNFCMTPMLLMTITIMLMTMMTVMLVSMTTMMVMVVCW